MQFFKNLFQTNYFLTCITYAASMGAAIALRVSLVFLLGNIFGLNDSEKFLIYGSFAISADLAAISTTYLVGKFFNSFLSCILAFTLGITGSSSVILAIYTKNISILFGGLCLVAICIGLIRSSLMSINAGYLESEFSQHNKKEYSSLLHFCTVSISFIIVFFAGAFVKTNIFLIALIPIIFILISFILFYTTQYKLIKSSFFNLLQQKFNPRKITNFLLILGSLIGICLAFFYYQQQHLLLSQSIPLIFFIGSYIYLIYRACKNPQERSCIKSAILNALLLVFYLCFERQRDTTIALFLQRNTQLQIFDLFTLTPLQINSLFSVVMLFISILCFKFKIHSKLNLQKILQIIPCLVGLSFGLIWLGCKFMADELHNVTIWPYLISMLMMAFCNVVIFARFSQVCSMASNEIRIIISSFMVGNMGFGAYLSRIIANFMAINHGTTNKQNSLIIYQNGFGTISIFCMSTLLLIIILQKFYQFKINENS